MSGGARAATSARSMPRPAAKLSRTTSMSRPRNGCRPMTSSAMVMPSAHQSRDVEPDERADQDVAGFHVPVPDARLVQCREGVGELLGHRTNQRRLEAPLLPVQPRAQVTPGDILHELVADVAGAPDLEHLDKVAGAP